MLINGEPSNVKRLIKKEKTFNVNVSSKADYLVEKFKKIGCIDADNCYFFFKKCFNNLSEDTIWSLYELAATKPGLESRIKYFIGACRNQMQK